MNLYPYQIHFLPISVKFGAEDLDVILYSKVEFRNIHYFELCKELSRLCSCAIYFWSDLDKIAKLKYIKMF
jgi:hypothetical protein